MNVQSIGNTYSVQEQGLMRIESAQGWVLVCEHGTLLVTQDRHRDDYILRDGDRLRLDNNGLVLVAAETDACFRLIRPQSFPQRLSFAGSR
jgi:hypothetical protein